MQRTSEVQQDRLSERHEALAQEMELVVSLHHDNEKRVAQVMDTMNRMGRIIEIHEQRHDEHEARLDKLEGHK
jgi:hypothetical protein